MPWRSFQLTKQQRAAYGAEHTGNRKGILSTGGSLVLGHIITSNLTSEPDFETQIKANSSHANDWPTGDPDGPHDRLNFSGLFSTDDDEYIQIAATGIQTPIPELGGIITGAEAGDLPFGAFQSVFVVSFRTGAAKYKNLEDSIFIASKTVKSLGSGGFRAGLRISTVYLTKTDITLN